MQVIVQSRLGEKIHTKSKPNAMGQDWVRAEFFLTTVVCKLQVYNIFMTVAHNKTVVVVATIKMSEMMIFS